MSVFVRHSALNCAIGATQGARSAALKAGPQRPEKISISLAEETISIPYHDIKCSPVNDAGRLYTLIDQVMTSFMKSVPLSTVELQKTALFLGSTSYDIGHSVPELIQNPDNLVQQLNPLSAIAEHIRRSHHIAGLTYAYCSACSSSMNALLHAKLLLDQGIIEHAIVIGCELYNPISVSGFYTLQLISPSACRPFSVSDGMVLGEAVAAVLLSKNRGDAELELAHGFSKTDTTNITCTNEDGTAIQHVIEQCLQHHLQNIAAIKCCGVGTINADRAELNGINSIFEKDIPLLSLKPYLGNTLGASGVAELVLLQELFQFESLPSGIFGSAASLRAIQGQSILLNNFGFGGNNACLWTKHHAA